MRRRTSPIARIPLARSMLRVLAGPVLVAGAGVAALVAATATEGFAALGLLAGGVTLIVLAIAGAAALTSVRLEVRESEMRLSWMGGARSYPLSRGSVTRVAVRGPRSVKLRPGLGAFGWAFGPARLRGSEPIELIRMRRTDTVIIVPTERGRVAVAPASEDQLLAALTRAARARQRMEAAGLSAAASATQPPANVAGEMPRARRRLRRPAIRARIGRLGALRPGLRALLIVLPAALAIGAWVMLDDRGLLPSSPPQLRLLIVSLGLAGPAALLGGVMARLWWPRLVPVVVLVALASLVIMARVVL